MIDKERCLVVMGGNYDQYLKSWTIEESQIGDKVWTKNIDEAHVFTFDEYVELRSLTHPQSASFSDVVIIEMGRRQAGVSKKCQLYNKWIDLKSRCEYAESYENIDVTEKAEYRN